MSRKIAISCLELFVIFCLGAVGAPSQSRPGGGTPASVSRHRPEGFLDYALGKINPNGTDYGALVREDRESVVRHTIDDLYFWSNVVTLMLLTGIVALVLFQSRSAEKREMIAASLIAQLWNGRVSDRLEIERRTEEFNQLVAAHNAETERSLALKSDSEAPTDLKRTVETLERRGTRTGTRATTNITGAAGSESPDAQASDDATTYGLQQRNTLLERQVEALRNTEANLRRRLNDTMAQVEQERSCNQNLKGA
jgi:hypothetical protein